MDHFRESEYGYNKEEVNQFINYVIRRTEENVVMIQKQKEEITRLKEQLEKYENLNQYYERLYEETKKECDEKKKLAEEKADLIISNAKDNANKIVHEALVQGELIEKEKKALKQRIATYHRKMKNLLLEQLDAFDDIEML